MKDPVIKAGVMGWPIEHSLSPRLHGYWLKKYNIPGSYMPIAVAPDRLDESLRALPEQGFTGVNLTIPHKEKASDIVDILDPVAKRTGAVNTIIVRVDKKLEGRNTDVFGFTQNVRDAGIAVKGKPAIVLGAGGAARAVIVALQDMGAGEIRLANRTQQRAEELAEVIGGAIKVFPWRKMPFDDAALLINATSLGMKNQPPLDVSIEDLPPHAAVADLVYVPLMTDLLRQAQKRGHKIVNGLGMLLHQARPAFEAFFGRDPEVTEELRTYMLGGK